jgi:hypothetical protein
LKFNSRKFAVASDPPNSALGARERHGVALQVSKRGDQVVFVAALRIKLLRLATSQLPENFPSIEPMLDRTPR